MNPNSILDAQGRPVRLAGELARGGEGAVFDMADKPDSVAKLYLHVPDRDKAEKIAVMVGMGTERLTALSAWPTATLHMPGGGLAGFVMPKLAGHRPVFQVYGPKLRLKQFPKADWRFLVHAAANVARAFGVVHGAGLVVGDVNQNSLFVGTDATVRFIDTDSMQVTHGGRRWLCEVGVGTHQPPEMQVASYRDVVRTANHDAFGLAVMVFQLLCIGRHPFAGRYNGSGEAPDIPEAIKASRYAYSADTRRTGMSAPPGSLPVSSLSPAVRAMFEAAFAPSAVRGGRPTADQWALELSSLGGSLLKCGVNAAHWFAAAAGSCPWCQVEGSSGVLLFPAVFVTGTAGVGIVLLWQQIEAVPDPGPLAPLDRPQARAGQPSPRIQAAARRARAQRMATLAFVVAGFVAVLALVPPAARFLPLASVAVVAAALWWSRRPVEAREAAETLADVRELWAELEGRWKPGPAVRFAALRQTLAGLKQEHDGLSERRARELRLLTADRKQQQLRVHLEGFAIATARIHGIGKGKVATLLSYGIETAADIEEARVKAVPGFGPTTAAALVAFRQFCQGTFRFDASRAAAPAQIAAMDGALAQRRAKLETELASGLAQLKAMESGERRHRRSLEAAADELRPVYGQALADARAMEKMI